MINEGNAKAVERERLVLTEMKRLQGFVEKLSGRFSNIEDKLVKINVSDDEMEAG